ncbi:MAG: FtsW/RodA/SpoVE family cell cycle protein [Campylobacterales bacterium]
MADRTLYYLVAATLAIGVIFSFSLTTYIGMSGGKSPAIYALIQFGAAVGGLWLMERLSRVEPEILIHRMGFLLFGIFFVIMALMPFMPESLVPVINGAKRWIKVGPVSISPVEFFKIGFIYFLAWSFSRKFYAMQERVAWRREMKLFIPYAAIFMIVLVLIVYMQNDLGQGMVLGAVMVMMLLFAGASFRLFSTIAGLGFVAVIALIFVSPYRMTKVIQWWAGAQDLILSLVPGFLAERLRVEPGEINQGYQVMQSLNAISHGGMMGQGIGNGVFKLGFVSDVHTDFVLAGIIEETGFVGALVIALLMLAIVFRILKIARRSSDPVFFLFSIGIGVMLVAQFAMNALGVAGMTPVKGITLPFISYGGSSILALALAMGMILSISRKVKL